MMQLQIECNRIPAQKQFCLTCSSLFEMTEAKVIVCNNQGKSYGEICSPCLRKGHQWISDRVNQLNQPQRKVTIRQTQNLEIPISA